MIVAQRFVEFLMDFIKESARWRSYQSCAAQAWKPQRIGRIEQSVQATGPTAIIGQPTAYEGGVELGGGRLFLQRNLVFSDKLQPRTRPFRIISAHAPPGRQALQPGA
jgi:hypothetical protein